mmetsp:Transcript_10130/g.24184  ORF Transcript_10130/g.24184 Transcript_10130/m.24184 type:complete len:339 (-) Transcript_10130:2182-3198(-)
MSEQYQQSDSQEKQPTQPQHKETKWYDAWIRWEKDDDETYEDDEPPLIRSYRYLSFLLPSSLIINLELRGFPSESEAIWTSTGLTLWRSAEFLCDYLVKHYGNIVQLRNDDDNTPCRILEVGSGLGRSGILMHLLAYASSSQQEEEEYAMTICRQQPQQQVVLTDGDTDVLAQLRSNIQHNLELNAKLLMISDDDDRSSSCSHRKNKSDLSCHQLIWGKDHAKAFVHHHRGQTTDDSKDNASSYFDVMIGSDLIYVAQVIEPLFETVQTLLHPKHGVFLMAHCVRRQGNEVDLDMVLDQARKVGLQYTQLHPKKHEKSCENDQEEGIFLYQFEWSTKD